MAWFERNAWAIFTGLMVIIVVFGLGDLQQGAATFVSGEVVLFGRLTGTTWDELRVADPGAAHFVDYQVRVGGIYLVMIGSLTAAISVTAFRRGERWAWYAMWVWPLGVAAAAALIANSMGPGTGIPIPIMSGAFFVVVMVATLGLSARRYLRGSQ
jgi:hypothetical protein